MKKLIASRPCCSEISPSPGNASLKDLLKTVSPEVRSHRALPRFIFQTANPGLLHGIALHMPDDEEFTETISGYFKSFFAGLGIETQECFDSEIRPAGAHFHVDETAEENLLVCENCGRADVPEFAPTIGKKTMHSAEPLAEIHTPGVKTIADVTQFFGVPSERFIKSILCIADDKPVVALVRGDDTLSIEKLAHHLGATVRPATAEEVLAHTGAPPGFVGPLLENTIPVHVDTLLQGTGAYITGALKKDYHVRGLVVGRDFTPADVLDLREGKPGDACPVCGAPVKPAKGAALAWSTSAAGLAPPQVTSKTGDNVKVACALVSLNLTETLFAVLMKKDKSEAWAWPACIAPFDVEVIVLHPRDETTRELAGKAAAELEQAGAELLCDDRDGPSPGDKFNDADLFGIPIRIVAGRKKAQERVLEVLEIRNGEKTTANISAGEIMEFVTVHGNSGLI
jgi:prolyl-tRNA synthetase